MDLCQLLSECEQLATRSGQPLELPHELAGQLAKPPIYSRTCLSCGARESLDGSVPCGH